MGLNGEPQIDVSGIGCLFAFLMCLWSECE
jgi:hypothetical protein